MNQNNFCVIMAGGKGSRFWPMSSNTTPKQFVDVLGIGHSMLQETFRRCELICPRENIIIVTASAYDDQVRQQIPHLLDYQVLCEPIRRNTAPCIAYAAAVINELNPNANVIVVPSDHAIFSDERFVNDINDAVTMANRYDWIITMGVRPNTPNTKYGYIQFSEEPSSAQQPNLHKVVTFTEKPPLEMAMQFIRTGEFFWNAGMFVWRLPVLMKAYRDHLPVIAEVCFSLGIESSSDDILQAYSSIEKISVDFGIMEKATNVHVLEANFGWSDVETWDSLYSTCDKDDNYNAIASGKVFAYDSRDCVVHLPQDKVLIMQGLHGYVVTQQGDITLICQRSQEEQTAKFISDYDLWKAEMTSKS